MRTNFLNFHIYVLIDKFIVRSPYHHWIDTSVAGLTSLLYLRSPYHHWIDTSVAGLSIHEGIIRPVIVLRHLHSLLNHVNIIKTKVFLPQA